MDSIKIAPCHIFRQFSEQYYLSKQWVKWATTVENEWMVWAHVSMTLVSAGNSVLPIGYLHGVCIGWAEIWCVRIDWVGQCHDVLHVARVGQYFSWTAIEVNGPWNTSLVTVVSAGKSFEQRTWLAYRRYRMGRNLISSRTGRSWSNRVGRSDNKWKEWADI